MGGGGSGSILRLAVFIFGTLVAAAMLAESYKVVAMRTAVPYWAAAASVHSVLALGAIVILHRVPQRLRDPQSNWLAWTPLMVVAGVTLLALASRFAFPQQMPVIVHIGLEPILWVVWIPVVEELVFRIGFGTLFREALGPWIGAYYSALFFAFMHSFPSYQRMTKFEVGLTLGPFLLGLACEFLWLKGHRIWVLIALHAACNATGIIFALIDARWLSWLGILYQ